MKYTIRVHCTQSYDIEVTDRETPESAVENALQTAYERATLPARSDFYAIDGAYEQDGKERSFEVIGRCVVCRNQIVQDDPNDYSGWVDADSADPGSAFAHRTCLPPETINPL